MDIEKLGKDLLQGEGADKLRSLADSPEAKKISTMIDEASLRKAASTGDTATLTSMLAQVLGSPEGQKLKSQLDGLMK